MLRPFQSSVVVLLSGVWLGTPTAAEATQYHIKFGLRAESTSGSGPPQPGTGEFGPGALAADYPWGSVGAEDGVILTNYTGGVVRALRVRVKDPARDAFVVDSPAVGNVLFASVWKKADGTEVIFNDGYVEAEDTFWSKVAPATPGDPPSKLFFGQAAARNFPIPAAGWERAYVQFRSRDKGPWPGLIAACPSKYRDIQVYGESSDGKLVCFLSQGRLLLYDDETKTTRPALLGKVILPVNRISTVKTDGREVFVLWRSGDEEGRIDPKGGKFGRPLGRAPKR